MILETSEREQLDDKLNPIRRIASCTKGQCWLMLHVEKFFSKIRRSEEHQKDGFVGRYRYTKEEMSRSVSENGCEVRADGVRWWRHWQ